MSVSLIGVLNITPDSFSDGGLYLDADKALAQARRLFAEGALIVDVGAESTNPWSSPLTPNEEWKRLYPVLTALLDEFPGKISLDTYHTETARKALELGPVMLNDVTTFRDPKMIEVAINYNAACVVSHLPLAAASIKVAHENANVSSLQQVKNELMTQRQKLIDAGLATDKIILDPGIGFGKTPELNRKLLRFAEKVPGIDVMIGYSRKRFLGENRMELAPNLEAGRIAIKSGAKYLRVHDVAGHMQLLS
jgi:dihydropteroate synthase